MRSVREPLQCRQDELVEMVDGVAVARGAREPEPRGEVEQDVGGLGQQEAAVPEDRGRQRRRRRRQRGGRGRGDEGPERRQVSRVAGGAVVADVGVGGAGRFEQEADEFAPARDGGPLFPSGVGNVSRRWLFFFFFFGGGGGGGGGGGRFVLPWMVFSWL